MRRSRPRRAWHSAHSQRTCEQEAGYAHKASIGDQTTVACERTNAVPVRASDAALADTRTASAVSDLSQRPDRPFDPFAEAVSVEACNTGNTIADRYAGP